MAVADDDDDVAVVVVVVAAASLLSTTSSFFVSSEPPLSSILSSSSWLSADESTLCVESFCSSSLSSSGFTVELSDFLVSSTLDWLAAVFSSTLTDRVNHFYFQTTQSTHFTGSIFFLSLTNYEKAKMMTARLIFGFCFLVLYTHANCYYYICIF